MAPLGRGGMGEVYRAAHALAPYDLAVKLLTGDKARSPKFRRRFFAEVEAMARLDHPHVAMVFDCGQVEPGHEVASQVAPGTPFVVVELASGGALADQPAPTRWADLSVLLGQLLEALAHAHARGVIHRDVKPGNVLVATEDDPRPGLKLADFGVAHLTDRAQGTPGVWSLGGTPRYMAPEQFYARWRDYGAWTDLYAFGCMAFELACGKTPFEGDDHAWLAWAHANAERPRLQPRFPVPEGFEAWVRRLLRPRPDERFRAAADARWSLQQLGSAPEAVDPVAALTFGPVSSSQIDSSTHTVDELDWAEARRLVGLVGAAPSPPDETPPLPERWAPETPAKGAPRPSGVGLGLFEVREAPLVDRTEERDLLWQTLREVQRERRPRVVVLRGSAGLGKSRLAEWLCGQASELAGLTALSAVHGPVLGPVDGLAGMVGRQLGTIGLSRAEAAARLEAQLESEDAAELLTLLYGDGEQSVGRRHAAVTRLVTTAARGRPSLVWIDDAQWGSDALAFAEHLLRAPMPPAALVLVTAQDEALATRPLEASRLASLEGLEGVRVLRVTPLSDADQTELLGPSVMGLSPRLAAQVAEVSAGHPLFGLALVGDWAERGRLRPTEAGFELVEASAQGLSELLGAQVGDVLDARLRQALRGAPDGARRALELAALAGTTVIPEEWDAALAALGGLQPEAARGVAERLFRRRLAIRRPGEPAGEGPWRFAHHLMRQRLLGESKDARPLHAAWARALEARWEAGERGLAWRLGYHLVEAGEVDLAVAPLKAAAEERLRLGQHAETLSVVALAGEALDTAGAPAEDPRRGALEALKVQALARSDRMVEAEAGARALQVRARDHAWGVPGAQACWLLGQICRMRGKPDEARRWYEEGLRRHRAEGEPLGEGDCLLGLARMALHEGRADVASAHLQAAERSFERAGAPARRADVVRGQALVARLEGDADTCRARLNEALALNESLDRLDAIATVLGDLADLARRQGDFEEARRLYEQVLARDARQGGGELAVSQLNLALLALERGELREAWRWVEAARERIELTEMRWLELGVLAAQLPCLAAEGRWGEWDAGLARVGAQIEALELIDEDLARPLEIAGECALEAGEAARAREVWRLALAQYQALGRSEAAARLTKRLSG